MRQGECINVIELFTIIKIKGSRFISLLVTNEKDAEIMLKGNASGKQFQVKDFQLISLLIFNYQIFRNFCRRFLQEKRFEFGKVLNQCPITMIIPLTFLVTA